MLIEIRDHTVVLRREVTDKKYYNNESLFLYRAKQALVRLGYDCIKKRAWKDGHLVDDTLMCIRDRKRRWMLYDSQHAIRNLAENFDSLGEVSLSIHQLEPNIIGGLLK
jgi:hypothetical protein